MLGKQSYRLESTQRWSFTIGSLGSGIPESTKLGNCYSRTSSLYTSWRTMSHMGESCGWVIWVTWVNHMDESHGWVIWVTWMSQVNESCGWVMWEKKHSPDITPSLRCSVPMHLIPSTKPIQPSISLGWLWTGPGRVNEWVVVSWWGPQRTGKRGTEWWNCCKP